MSAPFSETERLSALLRCRILDTPSEPCLDRISRLAAQFFAAPMAVVSFVTQDRSRFKSRYGFDALDPTGLAREASFCAHTILGRDALVVPDAAADGRFAGLPWVAGPPGIRFYAGTPLVTPDGFPVGTLAVMDTHPRGPLAAAQLDALRDFGALVQEELNRRFTAPVPPDDTLPDMLDALPVLIWSCDARGRATFLNRFWQEFSGRSLASGMGLGWLDLTHPEDRADVSAQVRAGIATRTDVMLEFRLRRADGEYRWMLDQARAQFGPDGSFAGFVGVCIDITNRKSAESTRARLAAIVQFAEQSIVSTNLDGVILSWNPASESLLGYSADEAQGRPLMSFVLPDRRDGVADVVERVRRGEPLQRFETVRIHKDGTLIPVSVSLSAIKDPEGRPIAFSAIATDLTPLKQAEAALREADDWLKLAQDAAGLGIWDWSVPEGTCTGSAQYFHLCGLPPRDSAMSFAEWLSLVHPEDRERMRAYYDNVLTETHALESEYRVVWPDGSIHWLVSKANVSHCDPAGRPVRIVGINLEITRLKQAEQARRDFQKRFRLLIEHGLEVIGVMDAATNVHYVSPSVERVFGYQPASLIGANVLQLIHPDDRPAVLQAIENIMQSPNRSASAQFRIQHRDGTWRHAESAATNCLHITELHGIVVNIRDITSRKLFEEQLVASRHQLRRLAGSIESAREQERIRIAREVHDELGQTLSALKMGLEGLAFPLSPRHVTSTKDFSRRVAALVRDVDVSINTVRRIAAELRPSILDDLGLSAALKWQIQEFESRTGIFCRCQGLREGLRLGAESSLAVFRIFQEILTNVVRHASANAVTIRVTFTGGWLTLRVADNGKGLDPKHLLDSHSLGLLGMRERALLLGGTVEFSARRGGGTVVIVHVPALASDPVPAPLPPPV